jgi:catechol 2,3-dioxygenase-like lactoylglutathione lyase family enzyme
MINSLDHLIIAVKNIEEAEQSYTKIFGTPSVWKGEHKELGTANVLFNFKNTYFELLAIKGEGLGAALVNHYLEESGEEFKVSIFKIEQYVGSA